MDSVQGLTSAKVVEHPPFSREMSTYIEAAPEIVFRYIADIRRHAEWSTDPLEIRLEPGPDHGPGATFTTTAHVGKGKILAQVCVVAEEPPLRFVYESRDLFGHHRWTITLRPDGTGTRLIQRMERLRGPLWLRLLQPYILWPTVGRRSVGKALASIKAQMEANS